MEIRVEHIYLDFISLIDLIFFFYQDCFYFWIGELKVTLSLQVLTFRLSVMVLGLCGLIGGILEQVL